MNASCNVNADSNIILAFFIIGCLLTILGTVLNLCSCLLFCRAKSLLNTPYAVFIIALSLADIVKLIAEYLVHILFFYIQHPYFVCSITWFLTMTSENTSYAFLCALGIERNLKVWTTDRRCLITRRTACIITIFIVLFVIIYNHLFLFFPTNVSYCFFNLYNQSILFSCDNAYYNAYGYTYSLTNLLLIENIGLNNFILPIFIISTNIILIFGLRRRAYQRRHRLGTIKHDDWRERSVVLYMLLSSLAFLLLTSPVGILGAWAVMHGQRIPTNNLALVLDLMEIIHHCSHFPILLMTSSIIRTKTIQILFQPSRSRQNSLTPRQHIRKHFPPQSSHQQEICLPQFHLPITIKRNTAQFNTPKTLVSRSAPQAHPIFLLKPIQYPTPNNPHVNQPATVIRPILSSNIQLPITRPPFVRRLLRPTFIRAPPPRLLAHERSSIKVEPVSIQPVTPGTESSLSTLSTISSSYEEIEKTKKCCHCLPCCQTKDKQQSIKTSPKIDQRPIYNYPNFKLQTRTIYMIIIFLFILFLIVIILLIVLIVVRR